MLGVAMYTTIKTLWEKTKNKTEIARLTGHDWKTVAKVVKNIEKGIEIPQYNPRESLIDGYKEKILKLLEQDLSGVRIHEKLREDGFIGSYPTVKRYINKIKRKENIFIRIHTKPGEEAQVDFGYLGMSKNDAGKNKKTWVFNMRLSYSRLDYYEKVYDQKVETFIACHIHAFEFFGGVPQYVKIDNLKAAILEANFYEPVYQQTYKDFAAYYEFSPIPCRVASPNDKGKVESGIKFVKSNFSKGRTFVSGTDLDNQLRVWNKDKNNRLHGTTRKVPFDVFMEEEKSLLASLPPVRFAISKISTRKVYHDCHIYVDYNYYSVPYEYVGKTVDTQLTDKFLKVFYKTEQIALHGRINLKGEFSTQISHYPSFKVFEEKEYQKIYEDKVGIIGPYSLELFNQVVVRKPKHWIRTVKGILSLTNVYSNDVIEKSCRRALAYELAEYQAVKKICKNSAYALPLEEAVI
jgi:transposase